MVPTQFGGGYGYAPQLNTGQAQVLENNSGQVFLSIMQDIGRDRKRIREQQRKENEMMIKDYSVPILGWDSDVKTELLEKRNEFEEEFLKVYSSGHRRGDGSKESIQAFRDLERKKEELMYLQRLSVEQKKEYMDSLAVLNKDANGIYDQKKTEENLARWKNMSIADRDKFTNPMLVRNPVNVAAIAQEAIDRVKVGKTESGFFDAPDNMRGIITTHNRDKAEVEAQLKGAWQGNARLRTEYELQGKDEEDFVKEYMPKTEWQTTDYQNKPQPSSSAWGSGTKRYEKADNLYQLVQRIYNKDKEAIERLNGVTEDGTYAVEANTKTVDGKEVLVLKMQQKGSKDAFGRPAPPKEMTFDLTDEAEFSRLVDIVKTIRSSGYGTTDTEDVKKIKDENGLTLQRVQKGITNPFSWQNLLENIKNVGKSKPKGPVGSEAKSTNNEPSNEWEQYKRNG